MEVRDFVRFDVLLESPAVEATTFNIALFLADVTADDVLNWEEKQNTKSYARGEIDSDFSSTSRTYKVATAIFQQNPAVEIFKVGRASPIKASPTPWT